MYKKELKYKDYDDQPISRTLHFNLDEVELMEFELAIEQRARDRGIILDPDKVDKEGATIAFINKVQETKNKAESFAFFKELINRSYGIKSPDGQQFIKNDAVLSDFRYTAAYPAMFMELMTNPDETISFMTGIVPQDLRAKAEELSTVDKAKAAANVSALYRTDGQ